MLRTVPHPVRWCTPGVGVGRSSYATPSPKLRRPQLAPDLATTTAGRWGARLPTMPAVGSGHTRRSHPLHTYDTPPLLSPPVPPPFAMDQVADAEVVALLAQTEFRRVKGASPLP